VAPLIADDIVVTDQTDVRCPQCAALVRAGSQWCTLCFADLRPAAAPVPVAVLEPSHAGARQIGATATADPEVKAAGWPCTHCEAIVSFDEPTCPTCGAGFLEGARGEPDLLDRIGRSGLPKSTQFMIIMGGAFAIIAVVIGALYIFGSIF